MRAPVRVKVCGIRRKEDAALAVDLGASALGFVFWPESPRAVTAEQARDLTRGLPPFVAAVGVFVNQPRPEVLDIAAHARLTAVQLHGDEDASEYEDTAVRVIKALPVGETFSIAAAEGVPAGMTVLLDAHDPVRRGGTGRTIDWTVAAAVARIRPAILSGGLTPGNVQEAVRAVSPYAVDVSSGVEAAPGVKDESKMRAFFAALFQPGRSRS
jgi:phosphoribosylanthranilate isomerase